MEGKNPGSHYHFLSEETQRRIEQLELRNPHPDDLLSEVTSLFQPDELREMTVEFALYWITAKCYEGKTEGMTVHEESSYKQATDLFRDELRDLLKRHEKWIEFLF